MADFPAFRGENTVKNSSLTRAGRERALTRPGSSFMIRQEFPAGCARLAGGRRA